MVMKIDETKESSFLVPSKLQEVDEDVASDDDKESNQGQDHDDLSADDELTNRISPEKEDALGKRDGQVPHKVDGSPPLERVQRNGPVIPSQKSSLFKGHAAGLDELQQEPARNRLQRNLPPDSSDEEQDVRLPLSPGAVENLSFSKKQRCEGRAEKPPTQKHMAKKTKEGMAALEAAAQAEFASSRCAKGLKHFSIVSRDEAIKFGTDNKDPELLGSPNVLIARNFEFEDGTKDWFHGQVNTKAQVICLLPL